jgi:hypothetical protein
MIEKYVSRYAENKEIKKDKKAILEGTRNRLNAIKITLKKFKEDEAKELNAVVSDLEAVVVDAIDALGIESPAVDTLITAGQEVSVQADVVDEPVIV